MTSTSDRSTSDRTRPRPGLDPRAGAALAARFVHSEPAAVRVASALSEQIVEGTLRPGTQLVEESVCAALGVSRNTVREAFSVLAGERIVVRIPNRGVFVAQPGASEVADLYAARLLIEPAAVRWGPPPDPEALGGLRQAVAAGRAARQEQDWDAVATANQQFHRRLVDAGGSQRIRAVFATLLAEMRLVFHATGNSSFHGPYVDDNARVTELLTLGRREEAADHLADYLTRARDDLLSRLHAG